MINLRIYLGHEAFSSRTVYIRRQAGKSRDRLARQLAESKAVSKANFTGLN